MPIDTKLPEGIDEFDVIVAGGGSAGCVVAGRLAAADPNLSVLLIEGGENNHDLENVQHPALFREHMFPGSRTAVSYKGHKSAELGDRHPVVQTGGVLGGGSSVNIMLYTRGQRSDYDAWNMPGWSTNDLVPYFQKLETYHGPGVKEIHGYKGPVQITRGSFQVPKTEDDFVRAAEKVGIPAKADMQDFDSGNGTEKWHGTIDASGRRQDAAYCYIHPLLADGQHPNFHVLCQKKVVRVLFDDDKRASGVEFIPNPEYVPVQSLGPTPSGPKIVRARKQVVISSGALGTPPILERSGIGGKAVLEKAGINPIVDLPGVGSNYQDHNLVWWMYRTTLDAIDTQDAFVSGRYLRNEALKKGDPILGWNGCDATFLQASQTQLSPPPPPPPQYPPHPLRPPLTTLPQQISAKIRPTASNLQTLTPKFQSLFTSDYAPYPDRPLAILTFHSAFAGPPNLVSPGAYVSVATYTTYPYSRGHIHITGPSFIEDELDFAPGFLSGENGDVDVEAHVWAYKKQREIMRRTAMYDGELELGHPVFAAGSGAALATSPVIQDGRVDEVRDLVYSEEDDKAIEKHLRANVATTWHSLGTAKMASREEGGVVSERLDVYGVKGLKVADMSIAPGNVGANTNNTALMIGEKAASLVGEELGLIV